MLNVLHLINTFLTFNDPLMAHHVHIPGWCTALMLQALIEAYRMTSIGEVYAREYTAGVIKGRPAGDAT